MLVVYLCLFSLVPSLALFLLETRFGGYDTSHVSDGWSHGAGRTEAVAS